MNALNRNIKALNNGKNHQPIYKVRVYEEGSKFCVGKIGAKETKFVEAARGTNLFFAMYHDAEKGKRVFETVPLHRVVMHQKQTANLSIDHRLPILPDPTKGSFLFTVSPNDLVYMPTEEEITNETLVDLDNLSKEQVARIYKIVSFTGNRLYGVPNNVAKSIQDKLEFTSLNKLEFSLDKRHIKHFCWKLITNRLGKVSAILRG
jgi:CRISPR-associated endonuclease Csn1